MNQLKIPASAHENTAGEPLVTRPDEVQEAPIPKRRDGLLRQLSHACREATRRLAAQGLLGYVYDNINLVFKIAEQVLRRKDTQQNGTCASAFMLYQATPEDLRTTDVLDAFDKAPPLSLKDILLSQAEKVELTTRLEHTVLRIIVKYGGDRFQRFKKPFEELELASSTPLRIPVHKTSIHPLPAMKIDESSVVGNAQVLDAIFKETDPYFDRPICREVFKLIWGDQLSLAHIRSIKSIRIGHACGLHAYINVGCGPGLFHYQLCTARSVLETHWGNTQLWTKNPGSLHHHNTILDRKPIVLSSLPPYHVCRELVFVSLYARIFYCLELVANCASLDEYAANVTFDELRMHASQIVLRFANNEKAEELRSARAAELDAQVPHAGDSKKELPNPKQGDMVFENASLFLRDALLFREFNDAISAGDSGRVVLVLRIFASHTEGVDAQNMPMRQ